eukprot:254724-Pelagomonas_calceolata.AAC.2
MPHSQNVTYTHIHTHGYKRRPVQSVVPATAAPTAYTDPTYTQPSKKQKKAAVATPTTAPATAPRASRPAPSSKSRAPVRSAPTTPAADDCVMPVPCLLVPRAFFCQGKSLRLPEPWIAALTVLCPGLQHVRVRMSPHDGQSYAPEEP